MVSALDSESNGPGSSSRVGTVLCSWARYLTRSNCLSPPRCINGYWQITAWGNSATDLS